MATEGMAEGMVFDTAGEDRQFLRDLAVSTIGLLVAYNLVIGAFPVLRLPENTKRCAWVLSIFSSCVCGPVCLPYVWRYVFQEWDETKMFEDDPVSRSLVTFFFAYLMVDTYYSVMHYSDQLAFLTGWGHHIFYMSLFYVALKYHFCIGIMTTFPLEISTIPLSLGRVNPRWRNDLAFGVLFFLTRILYHGFLLERWYNMKAPPLTLWPICAIVLVLHAHWMYSWFIGYMKRLKNGKGKKEEGPGPSEKKAGGQLFGSMD